MSTPAPEWMPAQCRLAIHAAVLASGGRDHWTGEPLAWELIGTYDNTEAAAGKGAHKKQYAMLPTIDHRSNEPGTDVVICAWRTNDAKHDMTPEDLLSFCRAVIAHSPTWQESGVASR